MNKINFKALARFSRGIERGFKPQFDFKLNRKEGELLMMLEHRPNRPFIEYAHHLRLEKSSFSYLVDLLETKELVEKVDNEEDKRKKTLKLTVKGSNTVEGLEVQHHEFMQERLRIFSKEELSELKNAVETVERLGKKLPDEPKKHPHHMNHK